MAEKLTMEELFAFVNKFKTNVIRPDIESKGNLSRTISYRGYTVLMKTYNRDPSLIYMWARLGTAQTTMGTFRVNKSNYRREILVALEQNAKGKCRCSYCGKWVPSSRISKYETGEIACDNKKCKKRALLAEEEKNEYSGYLPRK